MVGFRERFGRDLKMFVFTSLSFVTALWWHNAMQSTVDSVPFLKRHGYMTALSLTVLTVLFIAIMDTGKERGECTPLPLSF